MASGQNPNGGNAPASISPAATDTASDHHLFSPGQARVTWPAGAGADACCSAFSADVTSPAPFDRTSAWPGAPAASGDVAALVPSAVPVSSRAPAALRSACSGELAGPVPLPPLAAARLWCN